MKQTCFIGIISILEIISHNDPVFLYGKNIDQRIKGTLGITGLFCEKVLIGRKD